MGRKKPAAGARVGTINLNVIDAKSTARGTSICAYPKGRTWLRNGIAVAGRASIMLARSFINTGLLDGAANSYAPPGQARFCHLRAVSRAVGALGFTGPGERSVV